MKNFSEKLTIFNGDVQRRILNRTRVFLQNISFPAIHRGHFNRFTYLILDTWLLFMSVPSTYVLIANSHVKFSVDAMSDENCLK